MSAAVTPPDDLADVFAPWRAGPAMNRKPTPAIPAIPAIVEHRRGFTADSAPAIGCDSLRFSQRAAAGIAKIATPSQPLNRLETRASACESQKSQESQGYPGDSALAARAQARRVRLLAWGWTVEAADALLQRIADRDAADDRRACPECLHYRPGQCGNHRAAELGASDMGTPLAGLLQRCPAFLDVRQGGGTRGNDA